ncbi:replication-associated recombination protein A [Candidatus Shapirobacteria bacterium]|nr:replication-associated recombination protein A [Candidatus Shapirobacteria bacterium]
MTKKGASFAPLAERIRPKSLSEFVGQEHLVGKGKILRQMLESDQLFSLILWGPPGCGKTTLARLIAEMTDSDFIEYSAVSAKLADVRKVIEKAKENIKINRQLSFGKEKKIKRTILFIDEIHRFNKAQQDAFLPSVEDGTIILIGATTENPSFEVISPLLSRCRVLVLNPLSRKELGMIVDRGLKELGVKLEEKGRDFLLEAAYGDARQALNILEIVYTLYNKAKNCNSLNNIISLKYIEEAAQKSSLFNDRVGEEHYNTISAFIKSMRASDPDASLYYLARMVEAGEDPLFIARRMVVFASEDIGLAQPTALVVANAVFQACQTIGYPECRENLAHGAVYLALAKKDRSAYAAYMRALEDVKKYGNLPIPLELRNAPTALMKELGYGRGYEDYPKNKSLLPEKLKGKKYLLKRKA